MNETQLRRVLAAELGIEPDAITDETAGWDSLSTMKLTFAIEAELGSQLTDDQIATLTSWPRVKAAILGIEAPFYKVLVLDADGTLWDGIIGEGPVTPRPQERWLALQQRGVILCLATKNNPDDLARAWPGMLLQPEHFTVIECGWQPKTEMLRSIAAKLNVGLDAIVFVDDSPFEREAVATQLPVTVRTPDDDVDALFPVLVDTSKTEQYRALAAAEATRPLFASDDEYLRSLRIEVTFLHNRRKEIPRIAELCQKVNQFNLTSIRYTQGQIALVMDSSDVWTIHYKDRFGSQGCTGLLIVTPDNKVDTFLLSCRILGRGIEWVPWRRWRGQVLTAQYIATDRNAQVADFWERVGLDMVREENVRRVYVGGPRRYAADWIKVQWQ